VEASAKPTLCFSKPPDNSTVNPFGTEFFSSSHLYERTFTMALRTLTDDVVKGFHDSGMWNHTMLFEIVDEYAQRNPNALAVADQHQRLTYRQFVDRTKTIGAWLAEQGLESGCTVAYMAHSRIDVAVMHYACSRADLLFLPMSSAWRRTEMSALLRTARARVVVVPPATADFDYLKMVIELRSDLPELLMVGISDGPGGDFDLSTVRPHSQSFEVLDRVAHNPDLPRFVQVSSGTTQLPKLALWSDNNLRAFMGPYSRAVHLGPGDVAVSLAPANTGSIGYCYPIIAPLMTGGCGVLLEHWSTRGALELMQTENATVATGVPTQIIKLLQDPYHKVADLSSLRAFTWTGAGISPHQLKALEEAFDCRVQTNYGSTDGGTCTMLTIDDPAEKRTATVGRDVEGAEVKIVDATLEPVSDGEVGEIIWRGPTKTFGYMNEPNFDHAFVGDGWYRSGDLAQRDEDGYVKIVGRIKDLIIRGGQNISPMELEILISRHPDIVEVSVIGIPDEVYGERTCACLVATEVTVDDLADFLNAEGVAKFKFPERVELFEELPKTPGGKLSKIALKRVVAERDRQKTNPV